MWTRLEVTQETAAELAEALGRRRGTIDSYLERLGEAGLAVQRSGGWWRQVDDPLPALDAYAAEHGLERYEPRRNRICTATRLDGEP